MNRILFSCLIFFNISFLRAEITLADERYLPFTVELTADYTPEGESKPLPQGFRCVVLRMDESGRLLVDFSRRGTFSIPIEVTNAEIAVAASKESARTNTGNVVMIPRMAMFLANRIVTAEKDWEYVLRSDVVNTMTDWYLLYGSSDDLETAKSIEVASAFYSSLPDEQRKKTAFVYMDIEGNKSGIQAYYDTLKPSIQAMPGYLSSGYSKSLAHVGTQDHLPLLVQVASSGRILAKHSGVSDIRAFLDSGVRE
ncbi:hypothetical protein ACWPKS_14225 [Coraliomargarita sp. W4R72]